MGAVGYIPAVSERDYYQAEQARESAEIDATPEAERQEIRDIYAAKGFTGDLLEQVVDTITADREAWMATMMDEELHLQPVQTPDIMRSAVVITIATLIGHLIPLLPFVWLPRTAALITAIALSAGVLYRPQSSDARTASKQSGIQVIGPDNGSSTLVISNPSGCNSASPANSLTWATGPHRLERRRTTFLAVSKIVIYRPRTHNQAAQRAFYCDGSCGAGLGCRGTTRGTSTAVSLRDVCFLCIRMWHLRR
jgi:VIT family